MLNYKIERNADKFLEKAGGKYTYKYKGEDYEITQESLKSMDPGLQQSFGHFTAKKCGQPQPATSLIPTIKPVRGTNYLPPAVHAKGMNEIIKVRRELLRLARTEVIVEDKLDMPKVFRALITEPHTAFDHRKKTKEEKINLTLFVDTNVRYHINQHMRNPDAMLHNTLIAAATGIKGINLFHSSALHHIHYKGHHYEYFTDLYKDLPKKMREKVIVFTQGCGSIGTYHEIPKGAVHFCTGFVHGRNCGCHQIAKAELAKQHMHYGVANLQALKELKC